MTSELAFVMALAVASVAVTVGLLTAPRWLLRSLHRYRLWRVRDALADDILDGELPSEHPAVSHLLGEVQQTIDYIDHLTLWNLLWFTALDARLSPGARERLVDDSAPPSTKGLTRHQEALLAAHRSSLRTARVATVLLGSWVGAFLTVSQLPTVLLARSRRRRNVAAAAPVLTTHELADCLEHQPDPIPAGVRHTHGAGSPFSEAADEAAGTRLGQKVGERLGEALTTRGEALAAIGA